MRVLPVLQDRRTDAKLLFEVLHLFTRYFTAAAVTMSQHKKITTGKKSIIPRPHPAVLAYRPEAEPAAQCSGRYAGVFWVV